MQTTSQAAAVQLANEEKPCPVIGLMFQTHQEPYVLCATYHSQLATI